MPIPSETKTRKLRFYDWNHLHYRLLWAYDGSVWTDARVGLYSNWDTSCWLLRCGTLTLRTPGRAPLHVKPGQWVFVASPERHQTFSKDAKILSLHFQLTWPGELQVIDRLEHVVFNASDFPILERTATPIVRHLNRHFPDAGAFLIDQQCSVGNFLKVQNLFPAWLAAYFKVLDQLGIDSVRMKIDDQRVIRALAVLDGWPLAEPFTEEKLLLGINLSRAQLDHLFVAHCGKTPRRYYEERRLAEAKKMLSHADLPIKEVAFSLGFQYASHFSLWFQRLAGCNATSFRSTSRTEGRK